MKTVPFLCWAAFFVSAALTSCKKPAAEGPGGPPDVLVTEVIEKAWEKFATNDVVSRATRKAKREIFMPS